MISEEFKILILNGIEVEVTDEWYEIKKADDERWWRNELVVTLNLRVQKAPRAQKRGAELNSNYVNNWDEIGQMVILKPRTVYDRDRLEARPRI